MISFRDFINSTHTYPTDVVVHEDGSVTGKINGFESTYDNEQIFKSMTDPPTDEELKQLTACCLECDKKIQDNFFAESKDVYCFECGTKRSKTVDMILVEYNSNSEKLIPISYPFYQNN